MEAMLSEFEYFTPTIVQSAIVAEYEDVITTVNAINSDAAQELNTFEFNIPGATDLYRDLNNSYLMVKVKVVAGADGAAIAANTLVSPVNLFMHALFSNVTVTLCGKEVSEKDSMYAYRAYLETLLTYDPAVLKTRTAMEGWIRDDCAKMDQITSYHGTAGQEDPIAAARHKTIAESKVLVMVGRPHVDLFHQPLDIPPNCSMNIRFVPSKSTFHLMHAANTSFKVALVDAKLFIRTKKVNPEMVLAHKELLQRANMRFPMNRVTVNRYGISSGFKSIAVPLNFPSKLPKRLVIGFVANAAAAGTATLNPFNFENLKLTELSLSVNGNEVPAQGLKMDFGKKNYARAYFNTLAALELDTGNRAISVTPQEFAGGFTLFAFKIAPGPLEGTVFNAANSVGSIIVNASFEDALAKNIDMIVLAETPSVLEIDKLNAVTIV